MHFYIVCDPSDATTCRRFDDWAGACTFAQDQSAATGRVWTVLQSVYDSHAAPIDRLGSEILRDLDTLDARIGTLLAPEVGES